MPPLVVEGVRQSFADKEGLALVCSDPRIDLRRPLSRTEPIGTPDFARAIGVTFDVMSVYRHPTRADLIIAVYRHQVDACAEAGPAHLATSPTPHALRVRVGLQVRQDPLPGTVALPAPEQVIHPTPGAVPLRHVSPRYTVPNPAGQQVWSRALARHEQLAAACRTLSMHPSSATTQAATAAYEEAFDSTDAIINWLAETGAIRRKSS